MSYEKADAIVLEVLRMKISIIPQDMIDTQELRDILCYCFGDFGTPPSKAGFPMQTLLHSHFSKGEFIFFSK